MLTCSPTAYTTVCKQIFSPKHLAAGRLDDYAMFQLVRNFLSSNKKLVAEANLGKTLLSFLECHVSCGHSNTAFMLEEMTSQRVIVGDSKSSVFPLYVQSPFPGPGGSYNVADR